MSVFAVDADTGELVREGGALTRVEGADEMVQGVRVLWRLIRGEVFLRPGRGVDWPNLLQEDVPQQRIEQQLVDEALQEPGVVSVDLGEMTSDPVTRQASIADVVLVGDLPDQRRRVQVSDTFTRRNV